MMEEQQGKKMIIELDQAVYEKFEEYCAETNAEKSEIMSELLHYFLKDNMNTMDAMRKGYEEMARINLEICSEFDGCENEVHAHI
jgi:CopG family transcriptional regulator/antitoxin EndoAI